MYVCCVATACSKSCVVGCTQYVFLLSNVLTSCPHICTTGHLIGVAYRSSVDYCCCGHTHPTHYPTIIQKGILKNHFIINEIFWARPKECLEFTLPLTIWGDNWFICLMLLLLFMCWILWKNISNPECYHNNDAGPALLVSTLLLKLLLLRQLQLYITALSQVCQLQIAFFWKDCKGLFIYFYLSTVHVQV